MLSVTLLKTANGSDPAASPPGERGNSRFIKEVTNGEAEIKTDKGGAETNRAGEHADLCYGHGAGLSPDLNQLLLAKPVVPEQLRLDGRRLLFTVRHRRTPS